jgi:hypothetical protein
MVRGGDGDVKGQQKAKEVIDQLIICPWAQTKFIINKVYRQ